MSKKATIVGGGFTGCTMAYFLKNKGFEVTIYEASDVLGGGCRTHFYRGHPYTFGPHHLIIKTEDREAWDFFDSFTPLRKLDHHVITFPNGGDKFYNYPPIYSDIESMPNSERINKELSERDLTKQPNNLEEYWTGSVGETLYGMFVKEYSKKMWKIKSNAELDQDITFSLKKEPVRDSVKEYFEGAKVIAYPKGLDGYNPYFEKAVSGCMVVFNANIEKFDVEKKSVFVNGEWDSADILVSTTSPDKLLDYRYGELKYMGRDFLKIILPIEKITPEPYYFMYYAGDEPYTRIVEYKLLTGYESKETMIGIEIPSFNNKLYPYPTKAEVDRANRYFADLPDGVLSMGRQGAYKYKDMYEILCDCKKEIEKI